MNARIETVTAGDFQANCFIIIGKTNKAIIIDPGAEPELITTILEKRKLTVCAYMLTHGHFDHVGALAKLYTSMPAPIGLHKADLEWTFTKENSMPPFYDNPKQPREITRLLEDGQEFTDAGLKYRVISTPGHTPGSVCFFFHEENLLFSGDTLFAGSIGRTDLPGGNSRIMNSSLRKIAGLPPVTIIYPGHGPSSDLNYEKKHNFFMQSLM